MDIVDSAVFKEVVWVN